MPAIYPLEKNYNWEKKVNKLHPISTNKAISCFNFCCGNSMWLVAIMANGAKEKISNSLLLKGEITSTATPIKKAHKTFL